MKYIKHGEISELEAVHKRCSYIASCHAQEGDYCIELVEAPLSGIFRQGYLHEHATCSDRQSTLYDTYYSNVQFTLPLWRISAVRRNKPNRSKDCLLQCRPLRVLRICKQEGPSSPYP